MRTAGKNPNKPNTAVILYIIYRYSSQLHIYTRIYILHTLYNIAPLPHTRKKKHARTPYIYTVYIYYNMLFLIYIFLSIYASLYFLFFSSLCFFLYIFLCLFIYPFFILFYPFLFFPFLFIYLSFIYLSFYFIFLFILSLFLLFIYWQM